MKNEPQQVRFKAHYVGVRKLTPTYVLFREESLFYREISMGDVLTVDARLLKIRRDGSRWSFVHDFIKEDGKLAARITVDGAWMDLEKRKLTALPSQFLDQVFKLPKTDDFTIEDVVEKP